MMVYLFFSLANDKLRRDNGAWYHYCFAWENIKGEYKVYQDGQLKVQGVDLQKGGIIKSGGIVVLGQDQDTIGGGFGLADAFGGQLTELNMWDKVLSDSDVAAQYASCSIPQGSVLAWSVFKNLIHGNVKVKEP